MSTYNTYTQQPNFMPGMPSAPSVVTAAPGQSRLTYFIARNNGIPVPLIPADELPFSVKLQNVPRVLTPAQAYGLHYCGSAPYSGTTFQVEVDAATSTCMQRSTSQPQNEPSYIRSQANTNTKHFLAPDALARQALNNSTAISSVPSVVTVPKRPVSASETAMSWRRSDPVKPAPAITTSTDATQSVIDAILRSETGAEAAERIGYYPKDSTPPPSGVIPDQEKKEYCTYWILHGDCMYVQQGCRYKHEMPSKEKLHQIGIRHVPRWWQEQNAAIRMVGEKAIVGPLKKPEEWLNMRKGSDTSSETSTATAESKAASGTSVEEELATKQEKPAVPKSKSRSTSPVVPPTRPASPMDTGKERKPSCDVDLIDFAPLLPTPSSAKAPTPSSTQTTKRSVTISEPSIIKTPELATARTIKSPDSPPKTTKVFVPAGESPEAHIADAKKRERMAAGKASRTPSPSKNVKPGDVKILAKQSSEAKVEGLAASKWASKVDEGATAKETPKRGKSGCRIRRPASSSPAARKKTEAIGEKK
ncbi:hypothetical protein CLAFUR0_04572 [Fulvia fulva]|nr:hypothetical protein CLAFUR0_04572 [Fulvia fulva]